MRALLFIALFVWIGMLVARHSKASWIDKATWSKKDPKDQ